MNVSVPNSLLVFVALIVVIGLAIALRGVWRRVSFIVPWIVLALVLTWGWTSTNAPELLGLR